MVCLHCSDSYADTDTDNYTKNVTMDVNGMAL